MRTKKKELDTCGALVYTGCSCFNRLEAVFRCSLSLPSEIKNYQALKSGVEGVGKGLGVI